jgi:hypothetical protein
LTGSKKGFKRNKFNATKTIVNGTSYDSKKESRRGEELKMLERAGLISDLRFQVPFELQAHFRYNGKMERAITYVADAVYVQDGKTIVEDTKSKHTASLAVYRIKRKLFIVKYPEYVFRENI